ncbi:keratin-associated protein 21-1-like [Empidonax traillii]|uniref:keratin-associated protein 21-1-like n=1 Tax=Empidonax traillii TaxID=164674 RepID=UPI000FFD2052|nr:keratin-associated protein 21-1-like [Empidonax traillii]
MFPGSLEGLSLLGWEAAGRCIGTPPALSGSPNRSRDTFKAKRGREVAPRWLQVCLQFSKMTFLQCEDDCYSPCSYGGLYGYRGYDGGSSCGYRGYYGGLYGYRGLSGFGDRYGCGSLYGYRGIYGSGDCYGYGGLYRGFYGSGDCCGYPGFYSGRYGYPYRYGQRFGYGGCYSC